MGKSILRLKELIAATPGMTSKKLAELSNVTPTDISRYITGDVFPRPATLEAMAKALNVHIGELFIETEGIDQPINERVKRKLREALELLEGKKIKVVVIESKDSEQG